MCGIAGAVGPSQGASFQMELLGQARRMTAALAHRGPDGLGEWVGATTAVTLAFGHRRLAIIDLTEAGHQPFVSRDGRYALTYNGELYNYLELREELRQAGCEFTTDCDTEVFLQAYVTWGNAAFARMNGMWAAAIADLPRQRLVLTRDRFGEKPLYTCVRGGRMFFASEIKAILEGAGGQFKVHLPAVERFLGQSLLDAQPESFFEGISQIRAGHVTEMRLDPDAPMSMLPSTPYWTYSRDERARQSTHSQAEGELRYLLTDSVRLRLRSDVSTGVLLSGGLDSSAIAAVAAASQGRPPMLISAVSDMLEYDESGFAEAVGLWLGGYVHKVRLEADPDAAFAGIEQAIWHNDEPIGGFSSVAHYLLMKRAKDLGVTVLLSGQGADETLFGYLKYQPFYWQQLLRDRRYTKLASALWPQVLPPFPFLSRFRMGEARRYMGRLLPGRPEILGPALTSTGARLDLHLGQGGLEARQIADLDTFSVPALTHYEDRMSMAFAREVRLPFLDHRLVTFLLSLPEDFKLRRGWTKLILREAMRDRLPASVVWRRDKMGFSSPIAHWLRHEWRQRIHALFSGEMQSAELGLVDQPALMARYRDYCRSKGSGWEAADIFNGLSLEMWVRRFREHLA